MSPVRTRTPRRLVLSRETVRLLTPAGDDALPGGTNSAHDSCWETLCTTESGCEATVE